MEAQQQTRPFNLDHAKAGAPYSCRDGSPATILKWDAAHINYPLMGYITKNGYEYMEVWRADGQCDDQEGERNPRRDLVMLQLGMIDGKPFFVGDTIIGATGGKFVAEPRDKDGDIHAWRWPQPERVYPMSQLTEAEMVAICKSTPGNYRDSYEAIANAALRHAIDAGQVIPLDQHVREIGDAVAQEVKAGRAARDMAVAEAVRAQCIEDAQLSLSVPMFCAIARRLDLAAIIAGVGK